MQDAGEYIRHSLATLAYRGGKVLRGAPAGFGAFKVGDTSRTPSAILAHVGDLLEWALSLARGEKADIAAGRVGSDQAAPRREFE